MSIFETASKVVTFFMADTTDMRKKTKELTGDERKLAEAQLEAAEARNTHYKQWVKGLGEANQAMEGVNKVVNFAKESWKAYAESLRLTTAAGKANIDDLRKASLGLRTENELLSFAAKAQHGVIKASAADMETAQRAMVALTRAGFDQDEVYQKITNSMVKAKAEGLDDFGLAIRQGKTDAETYANVMTALAEKAASVKDGSLTGAEGVEAMGVRMHDSMEKMKQAIGRLVVALEPLLTALSKAVAFVADMAQQEMDMRDKGGAAGYMVDMQMTAKGMVRDPDDPRFWITKEEANGKTALRGFTSAGDVGAYRGRQALAGFTKAGSTDSFTTGLPQLIDLLHSIPSMDPWTKASLEDDVSRMLGKLKGGKGDGVSYAQIGSRGFDRNAGLNKSWLDQYGVGSQNRYGALDGMRGTGIENYDVSGLADSQQKAFIEEQTRKSRYEDYIKNGRATAQNDSVLAKTFGPLDELDLYKKAFEGFNTAIEGTFEAIITGSEPAGKAFKRLLADSLMGIGKQSAVEALKETAYAFGNFAYGNVAGGTMHLKSAGLHAAVAVAAGAAAHSIGTSAQVAAADKAAEQKAKDEEKAKKEEEKKGKGGSGGGSSKDGTTTVIYAYGDPFALDGPRARAREAQRMVQKVTGGNAGSDS